MDIDLVYLWVDGNDPIWQEKHKTCITNTEKNPLQTNCEGRYVDNDELKYSLRSVELYAPWIRRIFIVTDNQIPVWLNTSHSKIRIIDHKDIMPAICLPCFNSTVIEHFLYKIPGLSEHFLYANDDMFINKPITPDFFFATDGLPIIRFIHSLLRNWYLSFKKNILKIPLKNYPQIIQNAVELVKEKYHVYYNGTPHHNIDAYLKSDCQHTEQIFKKEIEVTFPNHTRSANDIHRSLYAFVSLAEKRGHLRYITQKISFRFHIQKKSHYHKLKIYDPILFCMNDSEYANQNDRRRLTAFLNRRFPDKSQFEK